MSLRTTLVSTTVLAALLLAGCSGDEEPAAKGEPDFCEPAVANWFAKATKAHPDDEPTPTGYEVTGRDPSGPSATCVLRLDYEDEDSIDWVLALGEQPGGGYEVFDGWYSPDSGTPQDRVRAATRDANAFNRLITKYEKNNGNPPGQIVMVENQTRAVTVTLDDDTSVTFAPGNHVQGYGPQVEKVCIVHVSGPWAQLNRSTGQVKSSAEGTCPGS